MKLQFNANEEYQKDAVNAVISVFEGQKSAASAFEFSVAPIRGALGFAEGGVGNRLSISESEVLKNVMRIQEANNIRKEDKVSALQGMHFSVEMETGTGKTYVYLRTIFELNKKYGFRKFIIVVPSVAIREGVLKNLEITRDHFKELYGNTPLDYFIYEGRRVSRLRSFATANNLQVMVMNIDAFKKDENVIHRYSDRLFGEKPIDFVRRVCPIVIVDEPQRMESEKSAMAIAGLQPLCTLRYSATHKNYHNLLYSLNPVQAYDLGLVKRIEVLSVREENSANDAYMKVERIISLRGHLKAGITIEVVGNDGIQKKSVSISTKAGKSDIYELSGKREQYRGFVVSGIDAEKGEVAFANGARAYLGAALGEADERLQKMQIEELIKEHFEKEKRLRPQGIKVLSLLFVDKVANYRDHENGGVPGKFALWFEELYEKYARSVEFRGLELPEARRAHDGYFSMDKKGMLKDTRGDSQDDRDTYDLIMRDKERLLSFEEPVRFIWSHSALREGWDNPNIFQLCTLREVSGDVERRQQIGRGLRLPVNQSGERVKDERVNILTVFANEHYEDFARNLQTEIERETGVTFSGRIKDRRTRKRAKLNKKVLLDENFKELWERIKHKTHYSVTFDSVELVEKAGKDIADMSAIAAPAIRIERATIEMDKREVKGVPRVSRSERVNGNALIPMPDALGYIAEQTALTRKTVFAILCRAARWDDLLLNPQQCMDLVVKKIAFALSEFMIDGIKYERVAGAEYEMTRFESDEIWTYFNARYEVKNKDKTPYDYVVFDSQDPEEIFARDLDSREDVKMYVKLPSWFTIDTPIGTYNPDWAIVFENDVKLYFVVETKGKSDMELLRPAEKQKIQCGKEHFDALGKVRFQGPVKKLSDVH